MQWLAHCRLLANNIKCPHCDIDLSLVAEPDGVDEHYGADISASLIDSDQDIWNIGCKTITHNYEHNIRLYRGYRAADVASVTT